MVLKTASVVGGATSSKSHKRHLSGLKMHKPFDPAASVQGMHLQRDSACTPRAARGRGVGAGSHKMPTSREQVRYMVAQPCSVAARFRRGQAALTCRWGIITKIC